MTVNDKMKSILYDSPNTAYLILLNKNMAGCTAVNRIQELLLKYTKCSKGCIAKPLHGPGLLA